VRAEIDGRKLDDNELLGICFTLYIGGLDTVSAHLSLMIRHLAEHADHQVYLGAHRDKIPAAVEEMMRAYGSAGGCEFVSRRRELVKQRSSPVIGPCISPGW
jgi:cytochrome P450